MHLRALRSITIICISLILLEPSLLLFLIGISRESFPLHCQREREERGGEGGRSRERERCTSPFPQGDSPYNARRNQCEIELKIELSAQ